MEQSQIMKLGDFCFKMMEAELIRHNHDFASIDMPGFGRRFLAELSQEERDLLNRLGPRPLTKAAADLLKTMGATNVPEPGDTHGPHADNH